MPGFDTGSVMYALNVDFTGTSLTGGTPQVNTDGQLLIGSTATPNIKVGTITSPFGTIAIGYNSPNITLDLAGGLTAIESINGDTGSITGNTVTIYANNAANNSGASVSFVNSGTTSTLNVTDGSNNTFVGLNSGSLTSNTQGNTAFGHSTLSSLNGSFTLGTNNCAFGNSALNKNVVGIGNCAFGAVSLANTTGSQNCAFGQTSLGNLITGTQNTALGTASGISYTGAESSNILIRNSGTLGESNTIRIGTQGSGSGQQSTCYIAGITGVSVSNLNVVTINTSTGQLGSQAAATRFVWNVVTTNQTGITNNGYIFISAGGALTISLPTTSAVGDTFAVVLDGATSWQITQAAGQQIRAANTTTTSGVGGTITSTGQGDSLTLVCRVANTTWTAISMIGNLTVV